ncbi:MAG: sulfotransferase [Acidobacteriota bacterium]
MNILKKINIRSTHYRNNILKKTENILIGRKFNVSQPQFFILGLPRSGTTLVYQYIIHRLDVAYFTNKAGEYGFAPCVITYLSKMINKPYISDFKSKYGKSNGKMAPREAGSFWLRFFDKNSYQLINSVNKNDISIIRKTIFCIKSIFSNAPFVNKNVKHLLRIKILNEIFPNSFFIIVNRDITDVGLSILDARKQIFSDLNKWWSVQPLNYNKIKDMDPLDQIGYQIFSINKKLNDDLKTISDKKIIYLDYSEFCRNPEKIINTIIEKSHKISYKNPPVKSFSERKRKAVNSDEKKLIEIIKTNSFLKD